MKSKYQQLFFLFLWIACSISVNAQIKRYVKPAATGTGDGSSWANASGGLQAMITASAAGDSVFVMKGVYTRVTGAFVAMKEGVKIYGSFDGTESFLSQRVIGNTAADSSVLNGNGGLTVDNNAALTSASIMDGFFITNTTDNNIDNTGSASVHINPTFSNLIIANGRGGNGAGVYNAYSSPTFNNVIFRSNSATGNGGAVYNINGSGPVFNNVVFENNASTVNGGAMFNQGGAGPSNPVFTDVIFRNNTAVLGGGMYNNSTSPIFNNVTFEDNTAGRGGGLYNYLNANPTLNDVKIIGNTATDATAGYGGGGMMNHSASPVLNRVVIKGNSAVSEGGGLSNRDNAHPTLNNVVISGNYSGRNGGGFYVNTSNSGGNPTLTNVTIAGNYAAISGGGLYNGTVITFRPLIRNSVIYGNNAPSGPNVINSSTMTFNNSLVQGSGGSTAWVATYGTDGGGNIDANPQFVSLVPATSAGATTDGNYSLQSSSSPANNAGSATYASNYGTLDVAGRERVQDGVVNMGAYEAFNVALPVDFGSVTATISGNVLMVNWQTVKETNVDHFEIEVSADGKDFKTISTLKSKADNGNSDSSIQYEQSIPLSAMTVMGISLFLLSIGMMFRRNKWLGGALLILGMNVFLFGCAKKDSELPSGSEKVYVRIKQVDKDGKASYSKVVTAVIK